MLPRIDIPTYDIVLPSTQELYKFRPFLIKEEKILLMAQTGDDMREKINAIKQIIRNCIVQDIDVDALSTFDIEYIFIRLRAKSIGNILSLSYTHTGCIGEEGEAAITKEIPFKLDLETVSISYTNGESHSNKIQITDDIGMIMKYPNFEIMNQMSESESFEDIVAVVSNCIEIIYQGDEVFNTSDHPASEVADFIESLTQEQFAKINSFFEDMPETTAECQVKCNKCDFVKTVRVTGITDFFS